MDSDYKFYTAEEITQYQLAKNDEMLIESDKLLANFYSVNRYGNVIAFRELRYEAKKKVNEFYFKHLHLGLKNGSLLAFGFKEPVNGNAHSLITKEHWRFLKLSYEHAIDNMRAAGGDVKYTGLTFLIDDELSEEYRTYLLGTSLTSPEPEKKSEKKVANRPNVTDDVKAEYKKRKNSNILCGNWIIECKSLLHWFNKNYTATLMESTIRRKVIQKGQYEQDFTAQEKRKDSVL